MELFVAWIPLLALVGLALTIWCLYQRFRRAALGWAAATVCILLCAVWWYAPFHVRLAAEESVLVNYEDDRHSERLVPGRDDPARRCPSAAPSSTTPGPTMSASGLRFASHAKGCFFSLSRRRNRRRPTP